LGLRDDGEDFNGFVRNVIEHSHLSNPEAILGLAQTPQTFDPALAHPGRFVAQVPFEGIPYFHPTIRRERPEGASRLRRQDDLIPHPGYNIARISCESNLAGGDEGSSPLAEGPP